MRNPSLFFLVSIFPFDPLTPLSLCYRKRSKILTSLRWAARGSEPPPSSPLPPLAGENERKNRNCFSLFLECYRKSSKSSPPRSPHAKTKENANCFSLFLKLFLTVSHCFSLFLTVSQVVSYWFLLDLTVSHWFSLFLTVS